MRYGRAGTVGSEGTRVRLFPQAPFLARYARPETITLSVPVGSVRPGPADPRMYTLWPVGKPEPYGPVRGMGHGPLPLYSWPPWDGPIEAPAMPGPDGHLDRIPLGTPQFELAHSYGLVRFTLDIWEGYLGGPFPWHFSAEYDELEITIFRGFDNSRVGWGYLELGSETWPDGTDEPFALNLDIVAHETGHLIVYGVVGMPDPIDDTGDYYGFHESAGDLVALLTAAHFGSVVDEMFDQTQGNLAAMNRLATFAELSPNTQIRVANNWARLRSFEGGWSDEHDLSLPLTGCLFDILVDLFHESLVERGLIDPAAEHLADLIERDESAFPILQALFEAAYPQNEAGFKEAFADARDLLGRYLGRCWPRLRGRPVTYGGIIRELLLIDREETGGRCARIIRNNALWRDIGRVEIGPRLTPPDKRSHGSSVRTIRPSETPSPQPPLLTRPCRAADHAFGHGRRLRARPGWAQPA
jgi:hypothetical protein